MAENRYKSWKDVARQQGIQLKEDEILDYKLPTTAYKNKYSEKKETQAFVQKSAKVPAVKSYDQKKRTWQQIAREQGMDVPDPVKEPEKSEKPSLLGRVGAGLNQIGNTTIGGMMSTIGTGREFLETGDEFILGKDLGKTKKGFDLSAKVSPSSKEFMQASDKLLRQAAIDSERGKYGLGAVGGTVYDVLTGAGQMGADIATSAITGAGMLPTMGFRAFGQGASEAREAGANLNQQVGYGALSAGIELGTEKLFGGPAIIKKLTGAGIADNLAKRTVGKLGQIISFSPRLTKILSAAGGMAEEGIEEVIAEALNPVAKRLTYDPNANPATLEEMAYAGLLGAGVAGVMGGAGNIINNRIEKRNSKAINQEYEKVINTLPEDSPIMERVNEFKNNNVKVTDDAKIWVINQARQQNNFTSETDRLMLNTEPTMQAQQEDNKPIERTFDNKENMMKPRYESTINQRPPINNFGIENINNAKEVKQNIYDFYKNSVISDSTTSKPIMNKNSGLPIEISRATVNQTFQVDEKYAEAADNEIKVAAMANLVDLIQNGTVEVVDKAETPSSKTTYANLTGTITVDNVPYSITLDIRRTDNGNKYFVHSLHTEVQETLSKANGIINNGVQNIVKQNDPVTYNIIDRIGQATGIKIRFVQSIDSPDGTRTDIANGQYDPSTKTLDLSLKSENPLLVVAKHEITHMLQQQSPKLYREYKYFVISTMQEASKEGYEAKFNTIKSLHERAGLEISKREIEDEIVADATELFLTNQDAINALAKENPTLGQKILDIIREFIKKVDDAIQGTTSKLMNVEQLRTAEQLWVNALNDVIENKQGNVAEGEAAVTEQYSLKENIGYHAGDLGKADYLNIMPGRGTGHFGTGTYFVGNEKDIDFANYKDRPRHIVSFEGYNLYKPKTTEEGRKLHKFLKNINDMSLLSGYEDVIDDIINGKVDGEYIDNLISTKFPYNSEFELNIDYSDIDDTNDIEKMLKQIDKKISETNIPPEVEERKRNIEQYQNFLDKLINNIENVKQGLKDKFNFSNDKINSTIKELYNYGTSNLNSTKMDSSSTVFMKNLGYDGIDVRGLKGLDDTEFGSVIYDVDKASVRFSLKDPVEETKDLIALHNLTEKKLKGVLELGGFPVPSIAITKAEYEHEGFGEISVIFSKDTISPTDRRNKVFASDVYSPTFPTVSLKLNEKVTKNIRNKINELIKDTNYKSKFNSMLDDDNMSDRIDRYGSFVEAYKFDSLMKLAYLKDKNILFEPVMQKKMYGSYEVELLDKVVKSLGDKLPSHYVSFDETMELEPQIRKIVNDFYRNLMKESDPNFIMHKEAIGFGELDGLLDYVRIYKREGSKNEIDRYKTEDKLKKVVKPKAFEKWLSELSEGIIEKKGLRNNKDPFMPSGNRRSWQQLHEDYNIDNVVKLLKGSIRDEEGFNYGLGSLRANLSKEFKSIKDIKDSKDLLLSDEEFTKIKEEYSNEYLALISRAMAYHPSPYGDAYDISMAEVAKKGNFVPSALKRELKADGFEEEIFDDEELIKDSLDFLKKLKSMPTSYFEAKPQRSVGFDEIAAVVAPKTTDKELLQQLKDKSVKVVKYDENIEGDRLKAVNSVKNVKFQLKDTRDSKEVERLKKINENLKEQFTFTKGVKLDKNAIKKLSRSLIKDYNSKYDRAQLETRMIELYAKIANNQIEYEDMEAETKAMARDIIENTSVLNDTMHKQYSELRNTLRNTPITLAERYYKDFDIVGGFKAFKKRNLSRIKLSDEGMEVDQLYQELVELYPELFNADVANPADQLMLIEDVLSGLVPIYENPFNQDINEAVEYLAVEIFEDFTSVPEARATFADRKKAELDKTKAELDKKKADNENNLAYTKYKSNEIKTKAVEIEREKARKKFDELKKKYEGKAYAAWWNQELSEQELIDNKDKIIALLKEKQKDNIAWLKYQNKEKISQVLDNEKAKRDKEVDKLKKRYTGEEYKTWWKNKLKENDIRSHYQEMIAELRTEKNEKIEQTAARYKERISGIYESRKMREVKASIGRKAKRLDAMLRKPTEKKHINKILEKSIAELLQQINFETDNRYKDEKLKLAHENKQLRLRDLRAEYEKIAKVSDEEGIQATADPYIMEALEMLNNKRLTDMNLEELEILNNIVGYFEHMVQGYNKAFLNGKWQDVSDKALGILMDLKTDTPHTESAYGAVNNFKDMMKWGMLTPQMFFERMGDTFYGLYGDFRDALDVKISNTKVAQDYMQELLKNSKDSIKEWTGSKTKATEFRVVGGTIELTPSQVMSLYMLLKREQARGHIFGLGIKAAPIEYKKDGKGVKRIKKQFEPVKIAPEDAVKIISTLSKEQRRIAEGIGKFLNTQSKQWVNEATLKNYGYELAKEENYFPIKTDRDFLKSDFDNTNLDPTFTSMGFLKSTVKGAGNAIIIEDIFDVYTEHADKSATYNAFLTVTESTKKIINFKTKQESIKQSMSRKYGNEAFSYLKKFMVDLQGGVKTEGGPAWANSLIRTAKRSVLGLNMRTIVQQPTAIIRASALIDVDYLMKGIAMKSDKEEMLLHSPIALWKSWGYFNLDTGRTMKDIILDSTPILDKQYIPIQKADDITWTKIWNAVKLEISDTNPGLKEGSKEYYEAVNDRFSNIIDRTQVVDTVMHRSDIMRQKDSGWKVLTSFMAEPTKSYNLLMNSKEKYENDKTDENKKAMLRTTAAWMATTAVNTFIISLVDMWRRDDKDKETLLNKWLDNILNDITGMVPMVRDIYSLLQGYSIKRMEYNGIEKVTRAAARTGDYVLEAVNGEKHKYPLRLLTKDWIESVSYVFGVSTANVTREIEAILKNYIRFTENDKGLANDVYEFMFRK